jgi:hypothetical protein
LGVLNSVACDERTCALRAPTVFSIRIKATTASGCFSKKSSATDRGIRQRLRVADERPLRAARANHVFYTDEKRIRIENTVMDKSNNGLRLILYKIADHSRMAFHPCAIDDPRRRFFVRAKSQRCNNVGRDLSRHVYKLFTSAPSE